MNKSLREVRLFCECVKRIRRKQKLPQEEVAHEAGVDRTYLSLIERFKIDPSLSHCFMLAKGLGTSLSKILKDVERL